VNLRFILAIFLVITLVLGFNTIQPATVEAAPSGGICEFYYGGYSATSVQRIVNAKPQFLVVETPAGMYHTSNPIKPYVNAGIKVFSYVAVGYCKEYMWQGEVVDKTYNTIMSLIDAVAAEGNYGVFFDESTADLYTPGQKSWSGHTVKDAIDRAHSRGLSVMLGIGSLGFSRNLWAADYILSDENYVNRSPGAEEIGYESRCVVIGQSARSASTAVTRTNTAWSKGFGYTYQCDTYGSMSSWFESYISQVTQTLTPATSTTYNVNISVSGSGTTNPAPGTCGPYASGSTVSVTATPSSGYKFDHWAGGISGTANPVTFTVNSNLSVQAVFTSISSGNTSSLRESYTKSNDQDNLGGTTWKGQTFTPAVTHTITKVRLPLLRQGSPTGNVTVSIRLTNSSGLPTGGNLASGSIACSTLTTSWSPAAWYDINLGTGYQLTAGTKYALIMSAPSAASSGIYYWVNTAGAYSKGTTIYSFNSGSSWSSYSGWDTNFEEWGY
jgi:hypothetical protein